MTIHKIIHLTFISLYVITATICIIVIYKKLKNKKAPKELTQQEYDATIVGIMVDVKNITEPFFNIWPYVNKLKMAKILSKKISEKQLVYKVYRNSKEAIEHILLTTEKENNFVVIVVDTNKKKAKGYFKLHLENQYEIG